MSERLQIVNDLIRDEIGKIIQLEVEFNDTLVTIMRADVSRTLEHATVFVSVIPENREKYAMKTLRKYIYSIQKLLNKRLVMRRVPQIRFEIDRGIEHIQKIEKLLKKS